MSRHKLSKILYVEDDPGIQIVAQLALKDVGGFIVRVCSSGQEALAAAAQFQPDLLLLDVMMPVMDGPTTLSRLRELDVTRDTPAIFMTAKVQTHEVENLRHQTSAIDVIAKPFDPMTLAGELQALWNNEQKQ